MSPLERFDLSEIEILLVQKKYFVLHVPRQTGKTTSMLTLVVYLNAGGQYRALYCNVKKTQTDREDVAKGMQNILVQLAERSLQDLCDDFLAENWPGFQAGGWMRWRDLPEDDVQYVTDLGLIRCKPQLAIANPIYREIIPRMLTATIQDTLSHQTACYITPDNRLDMDKLMAAFQQFFQEHSAHWLERFQYKEAGPQLLLQAFLQRVINSGGRIRAGIRPGPPAGGPAGAVAPGTCAR